MRKILGVYRINFRGNYLNRRAFSLCEIIVVMSLIAVFSVVSVLCYKRSIGGVTSVIGGADRLNRVIVQFVEAGGKFSDEGVPGSNVTNAVVVWPRDVDEISRVFVQGQWAGGVLHKAAAVTGGNGFVLLQNKENEGPYYPPRVVRAVEEVLVTD